MWQKLIFWSRQLSSAEQDRGLARLTAFSLTNLKIWKIKNEESFQKSGFNFCWKSMNLNVKIGEKSLTEDRQGRIEAKPKVSNKTKSVFVNLPKKKLVKSEPVSLFKWNLKNVCKIVPKSEFSIKFVKKPTLCLRISQKYLSNQSQFKRLNEN